MRNMGCDKGFTLLEVVIAVAILAVALGAIYPIYASTPGRLSRAESRALAANILETEIHDLILREDWASLPRAGDFEDWAWTLEGANHPHPSDTGTSADFLFKITGTIEPAISRLGAPIVFERIVVRKS